MTTPLNVDDSLDPGGLIGESYRIEGISLEEARSIFLDWAIKLDPSLDAQVSIRRLLALYGADAAHPMTKVLTDGLGAVTGGSRQGGSRARRGER